MVAENILKRLAFIRMFNVYLTNQIGEGVASHASGDMSLLRLAN